MIEANKVSRKVITCGSHYFQICMDNPFKRIKSFGYTKPIQFAISYLLEYILKALIVDVLFL
jgi:hypothetical protein